MSCPHYWQGRNETGGKEHHLGLHPRNNARGVQANLVQVFLYQAVDLHNQFVTVVSINLQYLTENKMNYMDFDKETTQSMLVYLPTQPGVLNKDNWAIHSNVSALVGLACHDSTTIFQRVWPTTEESKKHNVNIDNNNNKVVNVVKYDKNLSLFEAEWVEMWEAITNHM